MASHERRNAIALDDAYFYCRQLEERSAAPELFKICNALHCVDLALTHCDEQLGVTSLSLEAWQRIRDTLFAFLILDFDGAFLVFDEWGNIIEAGSEWPHVGQIEFFPNKMHRKYESYTGDFNRLPPAVLNPLRWAFAEGRLQVTPEDFRDALEQGELAKDVDDEHPDSGSGRHVGQKSEQMAGLNNPRNPGATVNARGSAPTNFQNAPRDLLDKLNSVCEEQAHEGKKKAHRRWWQLYWEANSCPNKRDKHQLQKEMVKLSSIWGTPEE